LDTNGFRLSGADLNAHPASYTSIWINHRPELKILLDGGSLKGTDVDAGPAEDPLKGEAVVGCDHGHAHLDVFFGDRFEGSGRADIGTDHTEEAGNVPRLDDGSPHGEPILQSRRFDGTVRAGIGAPLALDTKG
jgi:hypothetical protein